LDRIGDIFLERSEKSLEGDLKRTNASSGQNPRRRKTNSPDLAGLDWMDKTSTNTELLGGVLIWTETEEKERATGTYLKKFPQGGA